MNRSAPTTNPRKSIRRKCCFYPLDQIFYKSIFDYSRLWWVLLNCCSSNNSHSFSGVRGTVADLCLHWFFSRKWKVLSVTIDTYSLLSARPLTRTWAPILSEPLHPPSSHLCLLLPPCLVSAEWLLKEIPCSCRLSSWDEGNSLFYALRDVPVFLVESDKICSGIEKWLRLMMQRANIRKMDSGNRAARYHPHPSHQAIRGSRRKSIFLVSQSADATLSHVKPQSLQSRHKTQDILPLLVTAVCLSPTLFKAETPVCQGSVVQRNLQTLWTQTVMRLDCT